jgi:hypothetical protein
MTRSLPIRSLAQATAALVFLLVAAPPASAFWVPDGMRLASAPGDQVTPQSISDGLGGAIVVWSDSRGQSYDIYAQHISRRGTRLWGAGGVPVCVASGDQSSPGVVSDGSGGAIVVWQDDRFSDINLFAQRIGSDGTMMWAPGGVPVCTAPFSQTSASLVSIGSSGVIVAWQDYRSGASGRDVFAQRLDSSGQVQWAYDGVAFQTNRGGHPALADDGLGGAFVAWEDSLGTGSSHISAGRIGAAGSLEWGAGGIPITDFSGEQAAPRIALVGGGEAVVAWHDDRGPVTSVYAQRLDSTGVALWATGGTRVSSSTADGRDADLIADGSGGAFVVWEDYRGLNQPSLFAQRLSSSGSADWTDGGVAVSSNPTHQLGPMFGPDGNGGCVLAWYDFTPSVGTDIYAQRVDGLGNLLWGTTGARVCVADGNQSLPCITAGDSAQWIVSWQDFRSGAESDVFVARVLSDGSAVTIPPRNYLSPSAPNPFRTETAIAFGLMSPEKTQLLVFDINGRLVRTLIDASTPAGDRGVIWDGRDDRGNALASGVYFAVLKAGTSSFSRKITLLR